MDEHAPGQCNGTSRPRTMQWYVVHAQPFYGSDGILGPPWASGRAGGVYHSVGQWTGRNLYIAGQWTGRAAAFRGPVDGPEAAMQYRASGRASCFGQWTGHGSVLPWASGGAGSCRASLGQQTGQTVPCEVFASFVLRGLPSRHSRRALEVWSSMLPCPMADSLSGIDVYYRNYRYKSQGWQG